MADYAASAPPRARRYPRADTARAVSFVRRLDWVMLAAVGGLVGFGLWAIDGITRQDIAGDPNYFVTRQAIFAVMGAVGLVGALLVDPSVYRRYYKAIYGLLLGMLLVVTVIGTEVRGSTRWIDLGFFQFQPSEFGKLLLALFLAGLLAAQGKRITESRTTLIAIGAAVGADALRLPPARHRDGARVRRDPARGPVLRRDPLARPRDPRRRRNRPGGLRPLGRPRDGRRRPGAVPARPPDGVH